MYCLEENNMFKTLKVAGKVYHGCASLMYIRNKFNVSETKEA